MERLTTRHNGVAVIKDKSKHKEAMEKLACYEDMEEKNLDSLKLSIETLGLSTRAYNGIRRDGINSIRDLCSRTQEDLMRRRSMGRKTVDEIIQKLKEKGLELKKEEEI